MEDLLFIKGRFKNDVRLNVEKLINAVYIERERERDKNARFLFHPLFCTPDAAYKR